MLNVPTHRLLKAMEELAVLEGELDTAPGKVQAVGRAVTKLHELGQLAGQIGFPEIEQRVERVFQGWRNEAALYSLDVTRHECRETRAALVGACEATVFLAVAAADHKYYADSPLQSAGAASFPGANEELREAGKCLALNRDTASVYHSMRALELGLKAMATGLSVPLDRKMWGKLIEDLETAIQALTGRPRHPLADQYSEMAIHFRYLKDAWRNHVMHARQNYSRERAGEIIAHAARVVEDLAAIGIVEVP